MGDPDFQIGDTFDGLAAGKFATAVVRYNKSQRGLHIRCRIGQFFQAGCRNCDTAHDQIKLSGFKLGSHRIKFKRKKFEFDVHLTGQ
jgi:hypothetical protein